MIFAFMPHQVTLWLIYVSAAIALYWVPTIVAHWTRTDLDHRYSPNVGQVAVVNGVFGWTLLGWGVALYLALKKPQAITFATIGQSYRPDP